MASHSLLQRRPLGEAGRHDTYLGSPADSQTAPGEGGTKGKGERNGTGRERTGRDGTGRDGADE